MIGKRGSGKSTMTHAIIDTEIPYKIIISSEPFYIDKYPDAHIYYKYDIDICKNLIERQESMKNTNIDSRAIMIFDNCLVDISIYILEILMNGRHYNISYVLLMQFPLGIPPELRTNFDYVFLFEDDIPSNIKRLYEHYAGMFPDLNSFKQVFNQLTKDFGALVINNRDTRTNILDKIEWYEK